MIFLLTSKETILLTLDISYNVQYIMKNKSRYLYIVLVVVLVFVSLFLVKVFTKHTTDNTIGDTTINNTFTEDLKNTNLDFLLKEYPLKEVPLYKANKISSCKFIVNFDPKNTAYFDHTNFSYYNVVLYTDASQEEFLKYYENLFGGDKNTEYPMKDMVKGNIDKYKVTAAHYDNDNTGYIQVYLPANEFGKENIYFDKYPNLFEEDSGIIEAENSYGLLNQRGGQVEYAKYYTVTDSGDRDGDGKDDIDEFAVLISKYQDMYKSKDKYEYNTKDNELRWEEDGYSVIVNFSRDQGRLYLNMRRGISKEEM